MLATDRDSLARAAPKQLWPLLRSGRVDRPTAGMCDGYVQANLVILPRAQAFDFLLFAQRNPRPCPVIEVAEPGVAEPSITSPGADLRTDLTRYRVYENGELASEVEDIRPLWRNDLVPFLLGCSFTFEAALIRSGVPVRHIEQGSNVSMYETSIPCRPAGVFHGPLVVSMRPIPRDRVVRAVQVTSRFPNAHGAPIHIGDPAAIGIRDLARPDYGDPVEIRPNEVPVFWACGVTPQAAAVRSKPPLMITHAPGYMFITGMLDEDLAAL